VPSVRPREIDLARDPRTQPFDLGRGKPALLVHGFTGTPFEVRPLGEALARRGYRALGPRLAGHGISAEALGQTTAADWFGSARQALEILAPDGPVHLIGLSVGAMISLLLARDRPDRVASLTLISPAAQFTGQVGLFFKAFRFEALARRVPFLRKDGVGLEDREQAASAPYLDRVPTRLCIEVLRLIDEAKRAAAQVHVRSLVLYGGRDHTVSEAGVMRLVAKMQPPPLRVVKLARSGHLLPLDVERERAAQEVGDFVRHCDELAG
jgi:carboxylesterase